MITRKFIRNSLIYTIAGALPMASAVILLPFYLHYLPTAAYGSFSICLVFSALVQILVTYSFDTSVYIHYHELKSDPKKLNSFISSAFITMMLLGLIAVVILGVIGQLLFSWIWPGSELSFFPYGLISIGIGIFQAIFKVHGQLLQIREKSEPFFWSNVVSFSIIALTTIVGLKLFPNSLVGPLGGRLLATGLCAAWGLRRVFAEFGVHFVSPWKSTSFSFNVYTFIYQVQQWTINYFDRILILFFMPLSTTQSLVAVGLYEFAMKCLAPVELMLNGLNGAINPKVISLITEQKEKGSTQEINRYFYGQISVIMVAISIAIIGLCIGFDLFMKMGKYTNYYDAINYIPYLALVFILKTMRLYFVVPFTALKKMKELTVLNFVVTLLKLVLMFWLIAKWQIYGVIAATFIAFILEIILLWSALRKDYSMVFNRFKLMIAPFLFLIIVLVAEYSFGHHWIWSTVGYSLLCLSLLWAAYRREFAQLNLLKIVK